MSVMTGVSKCGMPSYTDSSSILGSTMIRRTSAGPDLNNRLSNMEFTPTDFPEPVVPATSRCGIFARSATIGWPEISCPRASVNGDFDSSKTVDESTSLKLTISLSSLGISMPTTDLPGITSTTRTLITDKERARSLAKLEMRDTLMPGAG